MRGRGARVKYISKTLRGVVHFTPLPLGRPRDESQKFKYSTGNLLFINIYLVLFRTVKLLNYVSKGKEFGINHHTNINNF